MRNTMKEEEQNIGIVKQLYDAYKRHDISSVLDMFTDHAVLHGPAPLQECSHGAAFTMVEGELQISSKLLASHLKPTNLSCGTL
jgi:ketosteroid isomerase-like protein